ncbi:hypothetical protein JOE31_001290 [Arthrobacter sp. PvP023]|uniref:hypothetical protein n=1 Tax=Micrococcaceae TaxID=1268 RepID=UPI001AE33388|nr:hypothetical protein [Arthrobacter sp. PvP023]MBP1135058.1 hypothetical protein [Arthrobacter sp. PvP023]
MPPDTELQRLSTLNSARAVLSTSTRLLRTVGHAGAADRIIRQATGSTGTPVVVFVGESGRGKSALVNLLAPDLRACDSETGGHALYRLVAPARADGDGDGTMTGSTVWVFPDGTRSANGPGDAIGMEVETAAGLLGDVVLLDAPSAGGLAGPQSLLNLKILEAASVAVFVTDAGSLLSSAEMAYVEQCSAQVESVGVVVTKTDLYPGSWQDVVAGNAALLKARIPRLADAFVLGVSAVVANAANSRTDPSLREALLDASGLPQFVLALTRDLAKAGTAPTANALRLARSALDAHRQTRLTQLVIADDPAEARAGMMTERQRLSELKDEQQRWTLDLERDLGELRAGVLRQASLKFDAWAADWKNRIQSTKALRDEKTTRQLTSDIFAELMALRADIINDSELQLSNLAHGVFRDVPLPAVLDDILRAAELPGDTPQLSSERRPGGFDPSQVMSLVMGSSIGGSAAGLVTGVGVATGAIVSTAVAGFATTIGIPFTVLGAGGWFAINRYYRQNMLEKTRLLAEIPRLAQAERAVVADYLDARLRRLKPEIVVTYRTQLQDSLAALQQLIRESQAQEQLSAQASQQRIDALKRDIATIDKHLADIDGSLTKLHLL